MSTLKIIECDQGDWTWIRARMGMPTASCFQTIVTTQGRGGRETYMRKLAGEIITGEPMSNYDNEHMARGRAMEEEVRDYYAFTENAVPQRVGFITNFGAGCSPDSLIGDAGMLEIKTAEPHILIERLLCDEFPSNHKAQCQGNLWIAERDWIDCAIYWPGMPRFVRRATRDEPFIKKLAEAVDKFNDELAEMVARVRRYGVTLTEGAEFQAA